MQRGESHRLAASFYSLRPVRWNRFVLVVGGLRADAREREREGMMGVRFAARLHWYILLILLILS